MFLAACSFYFDLIGNPSLGGQPINGRHFIIYKSYSAHSFVSAAIRLLGFEAGVHGCVPGTRFVFVYTPRHSGYPLRLQHAQYLSVVCRPVIVTAVSIRCTVHPLSSVTVARALCIHRSIHTLPPASVARPQAPA